MNLRVFLCFVRHDLCPEISFTDLILNAKFVDGGRGNNYEYDCWGLCLEVFRRFDMYIPDYSIVTEDLSNPSIIGAENKERITEAMLDYVTEINKEITRKRKEFGYDYLEITYSNSSDYIESE